MDNTEDSDQKTQYLRRKKRDAQNRITTFKSASITSTSSYIWTYRHTGCDVISVKTTVVPLQDGAMSDVKIFNTETKRIKAPYGSKGNKKMAHDSPFGEGLVVNIEAAKRKLNATLNGERRAFLGRLNSSRNLRALVESKAAIVIQAFYRGHLTRSQYKKIKDICEARKTLRSNVREYLTRSAQVSLVSWGQYRASYKLLRHNAAAAIQRVFRCFLSRRCLRRKRVEAVASRRLAAAIRVQNTFLKLTARKRKNFLSLFKIGNVRKVMSTRIQCAVRCFLSRVRVRRRRLALHWIAARMIQCWYRVQIAVRSAEIMHASSTKWHQWVCVRRIQCLIRKKLAWGRVGRIRDRKRAVASHNAAATIQSVARRVLARIRCRKLAQARSALASKIATDKEARESAENERKLLEEAKALLDETDIFLQARLGNIQEVDDLFNGRATDETHTPLDVDGEGNTLLLIAASTGSLSLCRKCMQWQFDVNHRNVVGYSALMLAVKGGHTSIVQYFILSTTWDVEMTESDASTMMVWAAGNTSAAGVDILMTLISKNISVNIIDFESGQAPVHAACAAGNVEALKILMKYRVNLDLIDETNHTPLHKACLSPTSHVFNILVQEESSKEDHIASLVKKLLLRDMDEKDCLLLAALGGHDDILANIEEMVTQGGGMPHEMPDAIEWTKDDIARGMRAAERGSEKSVSFLLAAGFDLTWVEVGTGITLALAALRSRKQCVIDIIMGAGADMSAIDAQGKSSLHIAFEQESRYVDKTATPKESVIESLVPYLLLHPLASSCQLSDKLLMVQDNDGNTPLHLAAMHGVSVAIDLLAPDSVATSLTVRNKHGFAPLLVACSHLEVLAVGRLLELGADPAVVDDKGRGCLWHVMHAHANVWEKRRNFGLISAEESLCEREGVVRRHCVGNDRDDGIIDSLRQACIKLLLQTDASNVLLRSLFVSPFATDPSFLAKTAQRDDKYISFVLSTYHPWLAANATSKNAVDDPVIKASDLTIKIDTENPPPPLSVDDVSVCDIFVRERSLALLLRDHWAGLSDVDCTRIVLSCMQFDGSDLRCLEEFIACLLARQPGAGTETTVTDNAAASAVSISTLQLCGLTLVGWAVSVGSIPTVELLKRLGLDISHPVDTLGNTAVHLAARIGCSKEMLRCLIAPPIKGGKGSKSGYLGMKIEARNMRGYTAAMEAAAGGHMAMLKTLVLDYTADAREALVAHHWAWCLYLAKKQEQNLVSTQTGRIGDDDRYYHARPDYLGKS